MNSFREYQRIKDKLYENYGKTHLCGNCVKMTKCVRNIIQMNNSSEKKKRLMSKYACFVTKYKVEPYDKLHKQTGFITVYKCNKFEFDGYREDGTRCVMN